MRSRFVCLALLVALASTTAHAQEGAPIVDQRYATWLAVFASGPLHGDLWLWADGHLRLYDAGEPQAVLLRPGLTWRVTPELFLTAGYAWTPSWARTPAPREWGELTFTDEHRLWQQVIVQPTDRASGLTGQLRVRLEQRFRTSGDPVGLRLRVLLRVHGPVTRDRALLVILWNELFVPLTDTGWQQIGFDQNRLFFGLGWQVLPGQVRFELGYTNVWLVRQPTDPVNHIAALNTFVAWQ